MPNTNIREVDYGVGKKIVKKKLIISVETLQTYRNKILLSLKKHTSQISIMILTKDHQV